MSRSELRMKVYPITPIPAPRQTRKDKYDPRDCVLRYRAFKDEVRLHRVDLPVPSKITFYLPMPKSWSKRDKAAFNGAPHTQKPDVDNLAKALLDAIFDKRQGKSDDSHVHSIWIEKRWSETGHITVEPLMAGL